MCVGWGTSVMLWIILTPPPPTPTHPLLLLMNTWGHTIDRTANAAAQDQDEGTAEGTIGPLPHTIDGTDSGHFWTPMSAGMRYCSEHY
jgi:hypothetical protein